MHKYFGVKRHGRFSQALRVRDSALPSRGPPDLCARVLPARFPSPCVKGKMAMPPLLEIQAARPQRALRGHSSAQSADTEQLWGPGQLWPPPVPRALPARPQTEKPYLPSGPSIANGSSLVLTVCANSLTLPAATFILELESVISEIQQKSYSLFSWESPYITKLPCSCLSFPLLPQSMAHGKCPAPPNVRTKEGPHRTASPTAQSRAHSHSAG